MTSALRTQTSPFSPSGIPLPSSSTIRTSMPGSGFPTQSGASRSMALVAWLTRPPVSVSP